MAMLPDTVDQVVADVSASVMLGAVSLDTPALYASGSSSTTASSTGAQSTSASIAAESPSLAQQAGESDSNPMATNDLATLFNQLIFDASTQERTDENCLVCR